LDVRNRRHQLLIEGGVKALPCTILGSGPALSNGVNCIPWIITIEEPQSRLFYGRKEI